MLSQGILSEFRILGIGTLLLAILGYCSFQNAVAQDSIHVPDPEPDTEYYVSHRDQVSLYTYGIVKLNSFELKNQQGLDMLKYRPNENLNIGLGFNYKWMGIGTAFNFTFLNNDSEIYGKSKSVDIQGDIYTESTIFTVNAQTYNGFYLENINDYDTSWNVLDSVPLRPDIGTINIGASGFFVVNSEKFSFKSAFNNTEWQKRSAGSVLIGGQASYYQLMSDGFLVPDLLWDSYPTYDSLANLRTFSIGGSIGYSYNLVIREKFYVHSTLMIGMGMQTAQGNNGFGNQVFWQSKPSFKSHIRISLGFNNNDYYYGLTLVSDNYPIKNEFESSFIYRYGKIRFFYGMHMDPEMFKRKKKKERL